MIRLGVRGWELHPGTSCAECPPGPGPRGRLWAGLFLQRYRNDPTAIAAIRDALGKDTPPFALTKLTTQGAIERMALLISHGDWHVHSPAVPKEAGAVGGESSVEEEDEAEMVSGLPVRNDRPAPPPPPPEEASLPRSADEAAIAAGMKLASELGIPFCEECARAALKRAREAAYA
jgi:hypothetical protein